MLKFILLATLLISNAHAVRFTLYDMCENRINHEERLSIMLESTVADITLYVFNTRNIEFIGSRYGINSIWGSPTGDDAIEIISDSEMRVYGWCYSVDGKEPNVLMNEVPIYPEQAHHVEWYFGYAEYKAGVWLSYCNPTHLDPPDFICEN